jgi:non-specific riboncleoside hydrolase
MVENFEKNLYRTSHEKVKVIIDTDPGVDDLACIIYAMNDENVDIKLLTTVVGNISIEKSTRNLLHVLHLFNENYPVAMGASQALKRVSPTAESVHSKEGMGGYIPPEKVEWKVLPEHAVDKMYEVISNGDGDIVPIMLGPLTNLALLLIKYPEIKNKIPKVVIMGGAPHGNKDYPEHVSFNLSSDPDALEVLLNSGIPIVMCPSHVGRIRAHLEEDFVLDLKNKGEVGNFLYQMYSTYWEKGYPTKRITTNDSCALFSIVYPKIFKFKTVNVCVDVKEVLGRTVIDFCEKGKIQFIDDVDKPVFLSLLETELDQMKDKKLQF